MIIKLAGLFGPRSRRGYVGRHRATRHIRYVARIPVQPAPPATEPADTSA